MSNTNGNGLKIPNRLDTKEFGLSSYSIDSSTVVMVLMVILFLIGLYSYITLPKEAQPDIAIPYVVVSTVYPGVSPADVENLVTQKIEDELNSIADIKKMTSTTVEGYSNIVLEFDTEVNLDEALQKVREKVDLAKSELPSDVEEPTVAEINLAQFPIMQVNVAGDYDLERLKQVAENLQDNLEAIPGVLEARLAGGLEREVYVNIDLAKMKYYGIEFKNVIESIQFENVTIPGGNVDVGSKKFLVRIPGEFSNPSQLADIVILAPGDTPIYLRDVAEVDFGYMERESYARLNGDPVITLSIVKRTGVNIIDVTDKVKALLAKEEANFPPGTTYNITNETAKMIRDTVSSLENNIISGLILVVGVLLFFMGVRNAFFVGIAIPLSMFISFIVFFVMDITLNMIVLFSLILALGMLVDNAIVVVENIYRYLEEGYGRVEAAKKGVGEVAFPIISGTVTTLAAFTPLMFWPGIIGDFMGYLPLTLIITLSSSLFVGLVINPVLCALFMRIDGAPTNKPLTPRGKWIIGGLAGATYLLFLLVSPVLWLMLAGTAILLYFLHKKFMAPIGYWWQREGMERLIQRYRRSLEWSLDHPATVILSAIAVLVISFPMFGAFNAGSELFPSSIPPTAAYIQVETPVGTLATETDRIVEMYETQIQSIPGVMDVESVVATSGSKISGGDMGGGSSSTHLGTVVVNFRDYNKRETDAFASLSYMQNEFEKYALGAKVVVELPANGPPTGKAVNLEIVGKDIEVLEQLSADVLAVIRNHPVSQKLEGLDSDLPDRRQELVVEVDRERAATFGLNTNKVGTTVRNAINGVEASKYRDGNDEYDIVVRLDDRYRSSLDAVGDLFVMAEGGRQVPISEVATWYVADGLGGINRKDTERVITVASDVRTGYNANEVLAEVQAVVEPLINELPRGYFMRWTGQQEEQMETMQFLGAAFLFAILLIVFTLVAQFNSVGKALIVMSTVLMAISGVLYALILLQMPFVIVMTGIGVITLAGVVVNNAIVLIDYVDMLRSRDGYELRAALIKAGMVRLRPVLLTAITTVLGLVPLAIGFNLDFLTLFTNPVLFFSDLGTYLYWGGEQAAWWAPMAVSVIAGLSFSTVLTLVFVPTVYLTLDKVVRMLNRNIYGIEKGLASAHGAIVKSDVQSNKEADILNPFLN